jgi:hypothetical protein
MASARYLEENVRGSDLELRGIVATRMGATEQVRRGQDGDTARKAHTHPERLRNPNISTNTPMALHLRKTRRMPPKKQAVPRSLFFRAKK